MYFLVFLVLAVVAVEKSVNVGVFRGKMKVEFCLGALAEVFPSHSLDQVSS